MQFKQIKNDLMEALAANKPKTVPYDTEAQVVRVEGSTAWVHIPGGVDETPVAMTINASAGDTVRVRVGNGTAWLVGNDTAPPTDDHTAIIASRQAAHAAAIARKTVELTEDLNQRIANANGLYETRITQPGGATITYMHNKPNLADSDIQMMISDVGVLVTANGTDASPTWYGLTVDGNLIANILQANGINADWINSGALVIYDDNDNEIFRADKTGKVFQWNMARSKLSNNGYLDLYSTSDEESAGVTITRKDSGGNVDLDQIMKIGADGIYATGLWSTNRSYSWHFSVTDPPRLRIEARDANNERHIFFVNFNSTLDEGETFDPGIWWDGYSLTTPMESTFTKPTSLASMTLGSTWTARVQKAGCTVTLAFNFNGYFTTTGTTVNTLFTLPAIYRPKYSMFKICETQSGVRYILTINSTGAIQIQNVSGASQSSAVFFREIITWVREMRVN